MHATKAAVEEGSQPAYLGSAVGRGRGADVGGDVQVGINIVAGLEEPA